MGFVEGVLAEWKLIVIGILCVIIAVFHFHTVPNLEANVATLNTQVGALSAENKGLKDGVALQNEGVNTLKNLRADFAQAIVDIRKLNEEAYKKSGLRIADILTKEIPKDCAGAMQYIRTRGQEYYIRWKDGQK